MPVEHIDAAAKRKHKIGFAFVSAGMNIYFGLADEGEQVRLSLVHALEQELVVQTVERHFSGEGVERIEHIERSVCGYYTGRQSTDAARDAVFIKVSSECQDTVRIVYRDFNLVDSQRLLAAVS